MIVLPGYKITSQIISGVRTVIYRGIREKDEQPIVVKLLKSEYPTLEELARLRQEYTILEDVACPGIVKPYSLEKYQNGYALILEDIGGKALNMVLSEGKYPLTECLRIAMAIADGLGELHKVPIIHKDIKPSNIIINEKTGEVRLTDFSIASRLACTNATPGQVKEGDEDLEGTLAYMSPEQTGRMNRSIDYRTDFYSLGVTLYEMLTGRLPFINTDPMELVHCHIAKQPVSPKQVNSEIPEAVAAIVMKLLAKRAEDRYQSAAGLKYDLEICQERLLAGGELSDFVPGRRDRSSQLLIPQKLYGREAEVTALMDAFDRVSQEGVAEMMLVSGYSGIGKTAIVNEVHKPIVKARGYFIAGKYDQFKRNIPYSAAIQAFSELMSQLLIESSQRLADWRAKLLEALGPNGQVIIDVIPEVELIIGPQPEVPQLGPSEGQNRFNRVFLQFIGVFCQAEHPLVLFLDDLQWADAASLKLIELLMTDTDSKYILTIGAYRDNEVSPTHPLMQTLEKMQASSAVVDNITIGPLSSADVSQLVADTLLGQQGSNDDQESPITSSEKLEALADLVFNKTGGNPFFLTQLLKSLYGENLLVYEVETGIWQWDMAEIQAVGITDYNVVELMARNIQKLPAATQQVLKLAACIGNKFNLQVLAIANGSSTTTTAGQLWEALQAGLLLPLSEAYKIPLVFGSQEDSTVGDVKVDYRFLHDRVQQATYSLIPEAEKKETHLKIGKQLLENTSAEERKENIFALVNQLNHGADLLATVSEKDELADMNLIASQKAKAAAAYEASLNYINVGLGLLEDESWQRNYDLMRSIYMEAVEVEYLNSNFERSKVVADAAMKQAKTLLEKVTVYELVLQADIAQNQMQAVLELGQQVLEMLGVSLEQEPPSIEMIEELEYLPEITEADKIAAMRILYNMSNAAFVADPELYSAIIFTCVNICKKYGNVPLAEIAYMDYAIIISAFMGDIDAGYRFGKLALRLLEKFNAKEHKSIVLDIFNGHIRHWKEHVRETTEPLQEAVQSGLESGELVYSGYAAINYCTHKFVLGEHLEYVDKKCDEYTKLLTKIKLEYHVPGLQIYQQMVLNLLGKSQSAVELKGAAFKEAEMLPFLKENQIFTLLFMGVQAKTFLSYLFKQPGEAVENAKLAEECISAVPGMIVVAQHNFYYSLALLAQYWHWEEREQKHALRKVASLQKQMHHWAEHAPCNFQHKYDLVEAERARVKGEQIEALELYEQAIQGAREQGYTHEEALANELAGEFHLARGHESMGRFYIIESYYGYIRWGAKAKVKDLESRYPQFLSRIATATARPQEIDVTRTRTATGSGSMAILDLPTVIEASQVISGEMVLGDLIEKLMQIAIENAGAEKGILLLNQNGKLVVSASGKVEADEIIVNQSEAEDMSQVLPIDLINYVDRKKNNLIVNKGDREYIRFSSDPYMMAVQPQSVLCTSIAHQGKLIGILYLENNQTTSAFTEERLEVLKLISSQAAISIENASLYANLESAKAQVEDYARNLEVKVEERTQELQEKNQKLEKTLKDLKNTQSQLIQSEKMSSLGQMVAGVAHEINNPVNFINGNLAYVQEYMTDILRLLTLYQETYPDPTTEIESEAEDMDLEFISKDLVKLLGSMQTGCDRIRDIVLSLRNFSRLDESDMKQVDIHSGINSTLMVLQHRLNDTETRPAIKVSTEYGRLPLVECYAGQLNQAFLNIISNSIDALEMGHEDELSQMTIRLRTEMSEGNTVAIKIADNGPGMTAEVQSKMFDPFFTTKPVGSGTGMGLSICYQIVVERHRGKLKCNSAVGQGSELIIELPIAQQKKENNIEMPKIIP